MSKRPPYSTRPTKSMGIAILAGAGILLGMNPGLVTARFGTASLLVLFVLIAVGLAFMSRTGAGGRGI